MKKMNGILRTASAMWRQTDNCQCHVETESELSVPCADRPRTARKHDPQRFDSCIKKSSCIHSWGCFAYVLEMDEMQSMQNLIVFFMCCAWFCQCSLSFVRRAA